MSTKQRSPAKSCASSRCDHPTSSKKNEWYVWMSHVMYSFHAVFPKPCACIWESTLHVVLNREGTLLILHLGQLMPIALRALLAKLATQNWRYWAGNAITFSSIIEPKSVRWWCSCATKRNTQFARANQYNILCITARAVLSYIVITHRLYKHPTTNP